jgi:hypothetical protein
MPAARRVASEGGLKYLLPARRAQARVRLDTLIQLDPQEAVTGPAEASRAEALLALSQHPSSFRYRERLEDAFRGFVSLLRTARSLRVGSSPPAEAAAAIRALSVRTG